MTASSPRYGEVFIARLGRGEGSEQSGTRPVVITSNDLFNAAAPVVTVVPITSLKPGRRVHPAEARLIRGAGGLRAESLALCHQVRTVSNARLGRRIGKLDEVHVAEIAAGLRLHLQL